MKPRSHTIFHFTKSLDVLKKILFDGFFWPRYSLEDFSWYNSETNFVAYPMVCFCDIPLSRIDEHVAFYGEFGIGLDRGWGESNGLNPVIYLSLSTNLSTSLNNILSNISTNINSNYFSSAADSNTIISYIKPVSGFVSADGTSEIKEFYQENEWRYVPRSDVVSTWISKEDFQNSVKLSECNNLTKKHAPLKFSASDVKYIFVKEESDIPAMVDFIQGELEGFPDKELKILVSRVVSLERIHSDF